MFKKKSEKPYTSDEARFPGVLEVPCSYIVKSVKVWMNTIHKDIMSVKNLDGINLTQHVLVRLGIDERDVVKLNELTYNQQKKALIMIINNKDVQCCGVNTSC